MADASVTEGASPSPDATRQPVQENPFKGTKHKVKVDGQERELDYDDLIRGYQMREAADTRMREAADLRKKLEAAWTSADPNHFFKSKNVDPIKWAEDLLLEKMRKENMTPEQKAAYDKDEELKLTKKQLEDLEGEKRQLITTQAIEQLDKGILDACKAINLSPNPLIIKRVAELMEAHLDTHAELMPPDQALGQIIGHLKKDASDYLTTLSVEQLMEALPKKTLDELRRRDVEKVMSQSPMRKTANGTAQAPTPREASRRASTEDFFKKLEARL